MNKFGSCYAIVVLSVCGLALPAAAADPRDAATAKAREFAWLSTDPTVIAAVREHNGTPSPETRAMTQDKWKELQVLDPFVRGLSKNILASYLKEKRDDSWSELFVSGADGTKVALFNKTTSWSHLGKPKHDVPMQGRTWIGQVEVDPSSGVEQIQIGLPVLDGGKAIGSVIIGFSVNKLK